MHDTYISYASQNQDTNFENVFMNKTVKTCILPGTGYFVNFLVKAVKVRYIINGSKPFKNRNYEQRNRTNRINPQNINKIPSTR